MYELPTPKGIKKYRKKLKLTQVELAKRAGVSQSLIARIEAGDVDPRLSTLKKILEAMKVEEIGDKCAENIMKAPVIHVHPSDTVGQASEIMEKYGISQLPVLEGDVQVGSISEAMVIKGMDLEKDLSKVSTKKIGDIMNGGFPAVEKKTGVKTLSKLLEIGPAVLIREKGKVVGIVTKADVLKLIER
jgi:predicted transcriptional regulator